MVPQQIETLNSTVSQEAAWGNDIPVLLKQVKPPPRETTSGISGAQDVDLALKIQLLPGLGEEERMWSICGVSFHRVFVP